MMSQFLISFLDAMMDPSQFVPLLLVLSTSNSSKSIHRSCHPQPFIHHKVCIANTSNSDYEDLSMAQSEYGSVLEEDDTVGGDH